MKLYKKLFATTLLLLSFIGSSVAVAQNAEKKNLTQEQILKGIPNGILNQLPRVQKWQDKENIEFINTTKDGADIFSYNVKTKKKTELGKKPKTELLRPATELKEFLALPNIKEYKNYTLSPNKKSVAFTNKDNNLCVYNVDSKEIKQLTNDGTNVIMNGYASWVYYEEILGRGSRYKAFWWSPDSKQLAFYKFDDTNVPMFPIYDSRGQHGYITETRYPKAGDNNPEVKIAFVNIESGNTVWADFDEKVDQYFGIPFWNADGSRFIIPWMPREQNHLVLYTVNPANGSKNPMYDEQQKTWIDWMSDMNFTATGFYMVRDFDLWEQIYFQSFDGKKLEKITDGKNWGVNIIKVDEKEGAIYFTARREISTRNDFYRVDLKTKEIKRLSLGEYNYTSIAIAPDNKHFVASYSNSVTPTKIAVISIGKKPVVDVIADSKGDEFDKYNIAIPQMLSITTSDGYVLPA
ncbi:MAG: DPP IV N-terminal domain-containing protein, partial [Bacteroidales bacterium]